MTRLTRCPRSASARTEKVDFCALAPRMLHTGRLAGWAASEVPVTFLAFDFPHPDGDDLTTLPLVERKLLLDGVHLVGPAWATNGWYPGEGDARLPLWAEMGHEGVVAIRLDAPYLPGRRTRYSLRVEATLVDLGTAPIEKPLRAKLRLLEKLTIVGTLQVEDIQAVLAEGVTAQQVEDALGVCFAFNTTNRLRNAFAFEVLSPDGFEAGAKYLLKRGYPIVPGRPISASIRRAKATEQAQLR